MSKDGALGRCKVYADALPTITAIVVAAFLTVRTADAAATAVYAIVPPLPDSDADCLAQAIYYEARGESLQGREAVAEVVLNRLHDRLYPKTVCGVVFQGAGRPGCQFTFACDGSRARAPSPDGWRDAQAVAALALSGAMVSPIGGATHYHAVWMRPAWSYAMTPGPRIGGHQFYVRSGARVAAVPYESASAAPQATVFRVWGLQVATIAPASAGP